jgi:transglutaminase-like putative cysteine protease
MAIHPGSDRRRERLIGFAAVGVLAASTALAFARVFEGGGAGWKLLVAALVSTLVAGAFERRGLVLATGAAVLALVLLAFWLVFPDTLWWGLPTDATLRAALDALGEVGHQAREQASPTAPIPPLLLAAVTAVFAASSSMYALAIRAGSPLLALVPSVALIAFADSALDGEGTVGLALLFLGGALAVLVTDGVRRVRRWGTLRPWDGPAGQRIGLVPRGVGGVAAVCVAAALVLPGALPGFSAGALLDLSTASEDALIDPLVSIKASLTREDPVELLRVRTENPTYLRMLALDFFNGTTWRTDDVTAEEGRTVLSGSEIRTDLPAEAPGIAQRIEVTEDLGSRWIPVPYEPTSIALSDAPSFSYDDELAIAVAPDPIEAGTLYTVAARSDPPTAQQLDLVKIRPRDEEDTYTQLPGNLPLQIEQVADDWTKGQPTPFRQVLEIQRRLRGFTYDLSVERRADGDALVDFLTETREGFCQQFAGAMAVLVRSLGYPARVVVGFTQGSAAGEGLYSVTTEDAHAWVEVFFPGYGWLPFEPTPRRSNPQAASYGLVAPNPCLRDGCVNGAGPGGKGAGGPRGLEPGGSGAAPATPATPEAPTTPAPVPLRPVLLVLLALTLGLLLLLPPVKAIRRRGHVARAREPRSLILATYDVFAARAADIGLGRRPGETIREYRARLAAATPASAARLDRLTAAATRAAYGRATPDRGDAREAHRDARGAIRDLRRSRGPVRRVTGVYRRGL